MKQQKQEGYIFKVRIYSYDSDHYKEYDEEIVFENRETLNRFCIDFSNLKKEKDTWRFGDYVDIEIYSKLLKEYDKNTWFDTGGASTTYQKIYRTITERILK